MSLTISLPAAEIYTPASAPQNRAFGDPGTTEQFALPLYIYIYIVKYKGEGDKANAANWLLWETINKSYLDETGINDDAKKAAWEAKWVKKRYTGLYDTYHDDVYEYTQTVFQPFEGNSFDGKVYVVASAVPLTLTAVTKGTSTLTDIQNITFQFDDGSDYANAVRDNLQNIYSTPYNYTGGRTDYYGSFYESENVPRFNLLLYHVASKVDLMWNVPDIMVDTNDDDAPDTKLRSLVKLSYIAAQNLYNGPCYVFRPTENEYAGALYTPGYTRTVLNEAPPSPGTQWYGRAYFYAIPYKNNENPKNYPLQLRLQKGGDDPAGTSYYSTTVKTEVGGTWTSWLRGQITINTATYNVVPSP